MKSIRAPILSGCFVAALLLCSAASAQAQELLPRHITPQTQASIKRGLAYLAKVQGKDGAFTADQDGQAYPICMTALAGMQMG